MAEQHTDEEFDAYQRQLALVDEILGLRAALAQESLRNSPPRQRLLDLESEIEEIRESVTWRAGRIVMLPVRVVKRLLRRDRP